MKGSEAKLAAYMDGSSKRFLIPVYQRNYDWKQENCKQLFDDLVKVIQKKRPSHFFGSIVSLYSPGTYDEFQIIDGQQRLTTVSLLLLAMYNLLQNGNIVSKNPHLAEKIYETYLIDKWQEDEIRIKLKPIKEDQEAFIRLFHDKNDFIPDSNLTINYCFFCEQIKKERITVDELYTAFTRLEIINITLHPDDNPQLIFESLNSTGLALQEGDKIRNFILMDLPVKEQNIYYEMYWNPLEKNTDYDVSAFIRDYLSVKQQAIPAFSKVYSTFKNYAEENDPDTKSLLEDMLAYSIRYQLLLHPATADPVLNACIDRLQRLETTVTVPFFLEVLRLWEETVLTIEQVREIFLYTESYLFRRTICEFPTNALNKIFLMLHREIVRLDGTTEKYPEKFKFILLSKTERGRFPRNTEFTEAFTSRQVYQMNSKNKIYILERFENGQTKEDKDIYRHCEAGTYSIEHIMPQALTPAWTDALGENYAVIHEEWLHRIANLTLTAYNSKYSNHTFADKRDRKDGFSDSGLRLNTWIAQQTQWTLRELEARNTLLMEKALEIWPMPETSYQPMEKHLESCTLEDDIDLSGREILRFEYKNTAHPVSTWASMQEQVLKMLHEQDRSVLSRLAHASSSENGLHTYISDMPEKLRKPLLLEDGIYIERNTSTPAKMSILRKLFDIYGAEPEDLVFYLKDGTFQAPEEEAGSRYELRRKYWTFALDYLHAAHGENGSYAHAKPTRENWLGGFFGIAGFYISCVANHDQARIDLILSKAEKEKNKEAFDFLYAQKNAIEEKLGTAVEWLRSDDTKGSFVVYRLTGVSIAEETDWVQMAKFHAAWSKKFLDVFVPLLEQWAE